jgi:hypothetical protein
MFDMRADCLWVGWSSCTAEVLESERVGKNERARDRRSHGGLYVPRFNREWDSNVLDGLTPDKEEGRPWLVGVTEMSRERSDSHWIPWSESHSCLCFGKRD